jgi:hypothetical protein
MGGSGLSLKLAAMRRQNGGYHPQYSCLEALDSQRSRARTAQRTVRVESGTGTLTGIAGGHGVCAVRVLAVGEDVAGIDALCAGREAGVDYVRL